MLATLDETLEPAPKVRLLIAHGDERRDRGRITGNRTVRHRELCMHAAQRGPDRVVEWVRRHGLHWIAKTTLARQIQKERDGRLGTRRIAPERVRLPRAMHILDELDARGL